MLRTIAIVCPFCEAETEISVSTPDGKEMHGSMSSCRACRERIMTVTLADGQVAYVDEGNLVALDLVDERRKEPPRQGNRDRHKVLPPQNLGLFNRGRTMAVPKGASDAEIETSIVDVSRLLWRQDGTPRPAKDAARSVGWRTIWMAQLQHSLLVRLSRPPPFSEPPGIFLSYRWGSDEDNGWVAALAEKLSGRGYRVILDRLVPPEQMDVPVFVSSLVDCQYFLAVIDPGYVQRLGGDDSSAVKDGWVFDEVNNAVHFENLGLLRIVGLLRNGTALPSRFSFAVPGQPGNTIDVRNAALLANFIDDVFPDRGMANRTTRWEAAEGTYSASLEALGRGEHQKALNLAGHLVQREPGIIDGYVQQVRVCLAAGAAEAGLDAAKTARDRFPDFAELDLAAAQFALELGDYKQATRHAARVLLASQVPGERYGQAHAVLGSAIDEFDQVDVALAHLALAVRHLGQQPLLLQNLGFVRRRNGQPELAAALFAEALEIEPTSVPLRTNQVASLVEAGEAIEARKGLDELARLNPDPKITKLLGDRLAELETTGLAAPLISRVPARAGTLRVTCSSCEVALTVGAKTVLCVGCGSPRTIGAGRCTFCDSDGQVPIVVAGSSLNCQCPFCRKGSLRVQPHAG